MASEEDVLSKALADLNLVLSSKFRLKQEQKIVVRALLDGKDVLAVLPTGYAKSFIYQMFVRSMDNKLDGQAPILVIFPLISISKDQISEMKLLWCSAMAASHLPLSETSGNFKMLATAEKVKEKGFWEILLDHVPTLVISVLMEWSRELSLT